MARLNATVLAEETGVPLPTAQKLVSRLAGGGLIESARGTGGGFRLARPASAISLADIIEAVEGPIALTTCVDEERHDCALDGHCAVKPHWGVVNEAVRGALAAVSLERLSSPAKGAQQSTTLLGPKAGAQLGETRDLNTEPTPRHQRDWAPAFAGELR